MANKARHQWLKFFNTDHIDTGKGDRAIVKEWAMSQHIKSASRRSWQKLGKHKASLKALEEKLA